VTLDDTHNANNATLREFAAGGVLTIAPGITIGGHSGSIGYDTAYNDGDPTNISLINDGTIAADVATIGGTAIVIHAPGTAAAASGFGFLNQSDGKVRAINSGILYVNAATWDNLGLITETSSTLNLGGSFTTAQAGISGTTGTGLSRSAGTVNLYGSLNAG